VAANRRDGRCAASSRGAKSGEEDSQDSVPLATSRASGGKPEGRSVRAFPAKAGKRARQDSNLRPPA